MSKIVNKGLLLIISSPSGAGKTTICKKLIDEVDNIDLSVSVPTRTKRKNEIVVDKEIHDSFSFRHIKVNIKIRNRFRSKWSMQLYAKLFYDSFFEFHPEFGKFKI